MTMETSSANIPNPSKMPKNQPTKPHATLLRRSGRTIQPWGVSGPVLACMSISDDSVMIKLLLIVARIVVCLRALLYQIYVTIQSFFHHDSSGTNPGRQRCCRIYLRSGGLKGDCPAAVR